MGNQYKHHFVLGVIDLFTAKDVLQHRNLAQTGNTGEALLILILKNTAQQVHFAFAQANLMIDLALADDRLIDSSDGDGVRLRGDVHRHLQRDIAVQVHSRLNINVHANIEVLELRVH